MEVVKKQLGLLQRPGTAGCFPSPTHVMATMFCKPNADVYI